MSGHMYRGYPPWDYVMNELEKTSGQSIALLPRGRITHREGMPGLLSSSQGLRSAAVVFMECLL